MPKKHCKRLTPCVKVRLKARGMTLLELLVVIAILGVLAALVASAGNRAVEEAYLVECRSNLRNIGMALGCYAKDHDGALPVSGVLDGPHPALVAAVKPYAGDVRIYYCPSETRPDRILSDENLRAGRISYFYFSCDQVTRNSGVSRFLRREVPWPRRLVNTMDSRTWVASDAWFGGEPTAHRGSKKGVNYLTLGGDVQFVAESPRQAFK